MAATAIPVPNSGEVVASSWGAAVAQAHNGIQSGSGSVAVAAAASGQIVVTFPRPFSAPPVVVATVNLGSTGYFAVANTITATGFTALMVQRDGTVATVTVPFSWVAIGLP